MNKTNINLRSAPRKRADRAPKRKTNSIPSRRDDTRTLLKQLRVCERKLKVQTEKLGRAKSELKEWRGLHSDRFEHAPIPFLVIDNKGMILEANAAACKLCKQKKPALLHINFRTVLTADSKKPFADFLFRLAQSKRRQVCDLELVVGGETRVFVHVQGSRSAHLQGAGQNLLSLVDISERIQAEEAWKESEGKYRLATEAGQTAVWRADLSTGRVEAGGTLERLIGYEPNEVAGNADWWMDATYPEDRKRVSTAWQACAEGKSDRYDVEHRVFHKDGSIRWLAIRAQGVRDSKGRVVAITGTTRDVNEPKQAEEALRQKDLRLEGAEQMAHLGHYEIDVATGSAKWSDETFHIFGMDPRRDSEPTVESYMKLLHPDDVDLLYSRFTESLESNSGFDLEYRIRAVDGTIKNVHSKGEVIVDAHGNAAKMVGMIQDITQRKCAEEELQESEQRFRLLAENAQDLIYRYRFVPTRGFEYVSPSATAITGYTPAEHYADPDLGFKLVHPDDRHLLEQAAHGEIPADVPLLLRWVKKDGSVVWTEQRNRLSFNKAGKLVALEGIARDVTERKRAEEALKKNSADLAARNEQLERWRSVTVDRELFMVKLKEEINELHRRLGEPPPYEIART